jgi:penicillin-binding protein 2
MRSARYFHWERLSGVSARRPVVADSLRRVRWGFLGFVLLLVVVFGRLIQLEVTQGAAFRAEAAKPLEREHLVPGVRGRILAADGSILACDQGTRALAVHYRWLEEPADPGWLRWMARTKLTRAERRNEQRVAEAKAKVLAERRAMADRVIRQTGISANQWDERARRIRTRVEHIRDSVNRRRKMAFEEQRVLDREAPGTFWARTREAVIEILRPSEADRFEPIRVAEEYDYHVMIDDVSLETVAVIEGAPKDYPAVKLVAQQRRSYPNDKRFAQILGYLGAVETEELDSDPTLHAEARVGRAGLELAYEKALHGTPGAAVERTDRSGRILSTSLQREPTVGRDLLLTVDVSLQQSAETLLEQALRRRALRSPDARAAGGAIVVLNARTGAILAAASAPTFDSNVFGGGNPSAVEQLLEDPSNPLFNRAIQMAIPPGSVFKVATAAALLQEGSIRPGEPMHCQGYLRSPDRLRCAIFRRQGIGHGEVTLSDALCESCNVYFLHHAARLGWTPIADWAWRLGFGHPTGIDLPQEVSGSLPLPRPVSEDGIDRHAELPSIGQGELTATPIQVARMMAAVANGGKLVTPHIVRGYGLPLADDETSSTKMPADRVTVASPEPIEGLSPAVLDAIRAGLVRTVIDPAGTAYDGDVQSTISWAGKTGTAETGLDGQEHAWFAGYTPADKPRIAFVVVLEHAGNASESAVPVAKRLVMQISSGSL